MAGADIPVGISSWVSAIGRVDVLSQVLGLGDYEAIANKAEPARVEDVEVLIVGLADLITAKEIARRDKDDAALYWLRQLRQRRLDLGVDREHGPDLEP